MSAKSFRMVTALIAAGLGGILAWVLIDNLPVWIPVTAIVVTIVIKYIVRRKTIDVLTDEREVYLGNKAGTFTYRILSFGMAILGMGFILFKDSLPSEYEVIGTTLAYAACAMLVIYIISYVYLYVRSR